MLVLASAAPARADGSPFVGRWHWNKAESKVPPGEPVPADMVADFSRVDSAHVRWSITMTNAHGVPTVESFDTPANGEFYPVSGDTTAAFVVKGNTLQGTFKGPSGEMDTLLCTLSSDTRKMRCDGKLTGMDGKSQSYVDVYDRN